MEQKDTASPASVRIEIAPNGPYLVQGGPPLFLEYIIPDQYGISREYKKGREFPVSQPMALCRCGRSGGKPFCDGSHAKARWDGTETAGREPYNETAELIEGPVVNLQDEESLCAFARFCDGDGGVWELSRSGESVEEAKLAVTKAHHCPGGRLVSSSATTGEPLEPSLRKSLALLEDPAQGCSGPLWVRGGIPVIGSDGYQYEVRNRVTLCRCGASGNKPFCDGSHASTHWKDGLGEVE